MKIDREDGGSAEDRQDESKMPKQVRLKALLTAVALVRPLKTR